MTCSFGGCERPTKTRWDLLCNTHAKQRAEGKTLTPIRNYATSPVSLTTMARRTILIDDYDGKELPADTTPLRLTLGRRSYNLYLSESSLEALYAALEPFIKDAEVEGTPAPQAAQKANRERTAAVRAWAQAEGIKQPNGKPLGDRGRIPQEIYDAYDEAH